ncbi:FAD-dependent oxidoreductase [Gryllotalpicola sp.]|uniref:NAD(P)/FAD-dependent oxidoreductase n=1 Tax=Gryllotalpicola sp. TaxID=1932787 RepID=UPI00260B10C9|nr:FAD-dependent oxidoreductase [Gryllotalpicola sp.]
MRIPSKNARQTTVFERSPIPDNIIARALSGSAKGSFWLADVGDRTVYPQLTAELDADLAIVGGGYLGLWTAIKAKQRGIARVVLLESETVGWAASGRNGGFCEASITHGDLNGEARWPHDMPTLKRLGDENLDAMERDIAEFGLDVDWERSGALDVAVEEHELEWLEADGPDSEVLDAAAVRAQVNSPTYLGAVWHKRSSALVHPGKLAKELARAASELGVEILENSRVIGLEARGGGGIVLRTERSAVRAHQVVLATNAFPSLLKRYRLLTVPVYDSALMTEPLSAAQLADIGWTNRQGIGDLANQFHYYRMSKDDRILFGGYDAIYHYGRRVDSAHEYRDETFRTLASHFFTTFPQLEGLTFSHRWSGAIDTSSQYCAFYGLDLGGRVATAAGFTGLGVGATHFAAEVLLDLLAGLATERTELAMVKKKPTPFPPEPFAYAAVQAMRASLDAADHRAGRRNLLLRAADAVGLGFDS